MKRFTSSPNYMLNCGLGLLFLVAAGVFLLIKASESREVLAVMVMRSPFIGRALPVLAAFAMCLLLSLVDIAAPAISLEGKNIWILQTFPVDPYAVFRAKLYVHIVVSILPVLFCTIALIVVLQPPVFAAICMVLCVLAFLFFSAVAMLALDLKRPVLDWTNETQPLKQNMNILFSFLGGFVLSIVLCALGLGVGLFAGAGVGLLLCTILLAVLTWLIHRWLKRRGRHIFLKEISAS